jgi:hypothetical protein
MMRIGLVLLLILLPALAHAQTPAAVRLALVVGSNDGGPTRGRLRYAVTDAQAMARVLTTLGGVEPRHLLILAEPDRGKFLQSLDELKTRLVQARTGRQRVEVVVYYSGHSDESGLLPGGQAVTYAELRQRLQGLPADVRIAILDSCASGALLRAKGGVLRAPFLLDAGTQVSGHAYLTSSSADEAAQESDALAASYFTANLIAGLRGAADASGDRRVTLSEAYQYAFHRTLARTEQTRRGPQHPAYDFELAGSGDVVMTDLTATSSVLVLTPPLQGRVLVRDAADRLIVELDKAPGRALELGLEPGTWRVLLLRGKAMLATAVLTRGQRTVLDESGFAQVAQVETRARGSDPLSTEVTATTEEDAGAGHVGVTLGLLPGIASGIPLGETDAVVDKVALYLLGGMHRSVHGIAWAPLFLIDREAGEKLLFTGGFHIAGGRGRGVHLIGGLDYVASGEHLIALSGGASVVAGHQQGILGAGGVTVIGGDGHGAQVAGGMNLTLGNLRGLQLAGGLNVTGGQLSGLQLAAVNVAGAVQGLQLGVLNLSQRVDGESIGVLSLVQNGYHHCEAWSGDTSLMSVGCKLGARHFYNLLVAQVGPDLPRAFGYGIGLHFDLARLYTDLDLSAYRRWEDRSAHVLHSQLRVAVGLPLYRHLALFAGLAINAAFAREDSVLPQSVFPQSPVLHPSAQTRAQLWPGAFVGVRL